MPSRWEFPGGKLADGETPGEALARELREELGIEVEQARPLIALHHDYPELSVDLAIFRIERYRGEPRPIEDQSLEWVPIAALPRWDLLEADRPIVAALQLPDRCWVTPTPASNPERYLRQVKAALKSGLQMLQCRLPAAEDVDRLTLGGAVRALCRECASLFIWNGTATEAETLEADGLHVSARRLMELDARPTSNGWVGASCHTEAEVRQANLLALDYIFVGTVEATPSHPGGRLLGWNGFERLAAASNLPVYAIGGMTPADIGRVQALGGQGIAAIRSLEGPRSRS